MTERRLTEKEIANIEFAIERRDTRLLIMDGVIGTLKRLLADREEDDEIRNALPKSADGAVIIPGRTYYEPRGRMINAMVPDIYTYDGYEHLSGYGDMLYTTEEAAAEHLESKGE